MRNTIRMILLGLGMLGAVPAHADVPWWFSFGPNFTRVAESDHNCGGGQTGAAFGSKLMLKVQYTAVSFEADDDGSDCDLGFYGDSDVSERAVMAGFASREGLFLVAGPARAHVHETRFGPWGVDTGTRVEIGWASRATTGAVAGFEVLLFHTANDVRDYGGAAINWTFGSRRGAAAAAGRPKGRY